MRCFSLLTIILLQYFSTSAQSPVIIPGYTGYATPAEKGEAMFTAPAGVQHWTNTGQQLHYFFYAHRKGELSIGLNMKSQVPGSVLQVTVAGKKMLVRVPASKSFQSAGVGTVMLPDSGFYSIDISALKKAGSTIADIQSLFLSGPPAASLHFNAKERRNAASVHLRYPLPDSVKAISFYNEITIPAGFEPVHTYYMACGFARGYFGIQVNSATERRVIFSVWDAGKEAVDRNKVADSNKVQLLAKGDGVYADGFGNEGTGGHSHWVYPWKTEQTYRFLVTALTDSASQTTTYTGFFFLPEQQRWKLIASFRAPKDGKELRNLYSFNEDFVGNNGQLQRKALFGNQWVQRENGSWIELTQSSFSYDATGKAGDRIDYGGGVAPDGKFYLWNGGFTKANAAYGDIFKRSAIGTRPVIDFRNADTLAQAQRDEQEILAAVRSGKEDTTGSKEGVYYKIVKEGTGRQVLLSDTVTVFYKGSLLKDGSIFDQTKEKPATFPLRRLIRGWQIAVPMCRVGGKIRIIIPSGIAYGIRARSKSIPPNSILVFDVEVAEAR